MPFKLAFQAAEQPDALVLCVLSASFLLAGELTVPILSEIYVEYLEPVPGNPVLLLVRRMLASFAFTTALGAILVLVGEWYFMHGRIPRGRFLVGLGIGLTSLTLVSKLAYATLVYGTPLAYLVPLAISLTGMGMLFGVGAHTAMGQYALLIKKRVRTMWRRWRRAHQPEPRRTSAPRQRRTRSTRT